MLEGCGADDGYVQPEKVGLNLLASYDLTIQISSI